MPAKKTYRSKRRDIMASVAAPAAEIASDDNLTSKPPSETKNAAPANLKNEKGADLQREAGADLTTKNRLKDSSNIGLNTEPTASYNDYIKDRKRYNKHAAKLRQYAQPYNSVLEDDPETPVTDEPEAQEESISDDSESLEYVADAPDKKSRARPRSPGKDSTTGKAPPHDDTAKPVDAGDSRWSKVKESEVDSAAPPKAHKLRIETSKLGTSNKTKLKPKGENKLTEASPTTTLQKNDKTQKDVNRKKQYDKEQGKLHDKADKLTKKDSKLRENLAAAVAAMPVETTHTKERVYDETTGKVIINTKIETRTLHQNEAPWNNPSFTKRLRKAKGAKEKAKVIGGEAAKKGAELGAAGAAGAAIGIGAAPAAAGLIAAKPALKYGSKLMVNSIHRQVRKDIQQSNNEVLKAAHWAEQKGERALSQGARKLSPASIRRYVKNAPYRRESKLQVKQLKNDRKLGLLRVKQDKASGINHMTGKKSTVLSRTMQKRRIKKNYQKAMQAVKGKSGGTLGGIARELARGNPKAIVAVLVRKIALAAIKFVANITVLNPLFWKLMGIVLIFLIILGSIKACVALFSPGMAGAGFVSEEDISFVTRAYSGWEVDMKLFFDEANIAAEFPPPAHITSQPTVNGVVVYPEYPYTPPPPFYEYRFAIGLISHDPMELISYLTARHGERFDEDSANPMTRSDLEAILREIFAEQYGVSPGDFNSLVHEEIETRFRRERRTVYEEVVYEDIYYEFWILTITLQPRNLSDVLRSRMTADEEMHFDVLNITGNGKQVIGNPFNFSWLPNITSHYGYRINPTGDEKQLHLGIDIAAPQGTPIFATHSGVITQVQFSDTGYGNMIRLYGEGMDGEMIEALFAHLYEIHVVDGQEVAQGDLIATVGSTGNSTGPHLHLEVIRQSPLMHLNPIFAVVTWTDEESNESFRPEPGAGGIRNVGPLFIPEIPPEAMSDERFASILNEAVRHLGARYVWGGAGPTTFDCSGFIHWVFTNAGIGWTHGRTTSQGYFNLSTPVTAENARPGDLVFFHSTHSGALVTHVGIYVGGGQMIHTGGNPAGVEFVSINTPFWQRHFYAFGRI